VGNEKEEIINEYEPQERRTHKHFQVEPLAVNWMIIAQAIRKDEK
jgi:hypothetical protein